MEQKLKLKESIYILKDVETYKVISTSTRTVGEYKLDTLAQEVIKQLKKAQTESNLISILSGNHPSEKIKACVGILEKEGIVRRYDEKSKDSRFYRQLLFIDELTDSWEETLALQKRIEDSKVAVFGIGGIGTWIVNGLNQIGVGEIRVVDPDIVEKSNLNRQLYFSSSDIGKKKVDAIRDNLRDANIIPFEKRVSDNEDLEEIVRGTDFLVNCADSPSVEATTKIIDRYATSYGIPYCMAGGYNMHLGMVGPVIIPGETATFQDFLDYQKANDKLSQLEVVKDIEQAGNLGPIAGAIANIQVMEVFKYLTGKGKINKNKFAEIDFLDFNVSWRYFGKDKSISPDTPIKP